MEMNILITTKSLQYLVHISHSVNIYQMDVTATFHTHTCFFSIAPVHIHPFLSIPIHNQIVS